MYQINHDPQLKDQIDEDWKAVQAEFGPRRLETAGPPVHPACRRNSGWDAQMYLAVYRVTGDAGALTYAKPLVNSGLRPVAGMTQLGGGLWYQRREGKVKSAVPGGGRAGGWQLVTS